MAVPSIARLSVAGIVGAGLVLLAAWLFGAFENGDDDRPPIIVSNGSVQIRALPVNGDPGSWSRVDAKFQHDHDNDPPSSLRVHVSSTNEPQCRNRNFPNATGLEFALTGAAPFQIRLEGGAVNVLPGGHPVTDAGPLLTLDSGSATMSAVTILFGAGGGSQTCTFANAQGAVLIEQSR